MRVSRTPRLVLLLGLLLASVSLFAVPAASHSLASGTVQRGRPPRLGDPIKQPRNLMPPSAAVVPRTAANLNPAADKGHAPPADLKPPAAATPVHYPTADAADAAVLNTHAAHGSSASPTH